MLPTLDAALEITISIKGHLAQVAGRLRLDYFGMLYQAAMRITFAVEVKLLLTDKSAVAGLAAVRTLLRNGLVSTLLAPGRRAQDVPRFPP